ncbi:MAG: hypothetical protein ACU0AT_10965 [Tranquillimonas sp.]|jgi:hypothetical protein
MSPAAGPVYLERRSYRRRRLADAARLLPVLGAGLFAFPLLWGGGAAGSTALRGLYLFAVWGALILAGGLISRRLVRSEPSDDSG